MNIAREHRAAVTRLVEAAERGEPVFLTVDEAAGLFACLGALSGVIEAEEQDTENLLGWGLDALAREKKAQLLMYYEETGVISSEPKRERRDN